MSWVLVPGPDLFTCQILYVGRIRGLNDLEKDLLVVCGSAPVFEVGRQVQFRR